MPLIRWRKQQLRERYYAPQFRGMYDRFSDVIHEYVRAGDAMLDAGCGSGRVFQYHFNDAHRPRLICGVDMTDEPKGNRNIDAAARADLAHLPFADASFDIAISSHVAEHLTQPERVFEVILEDASASAAGVEHRVASSNVLVDYVGEGVVHAAE